MFAISVEIFLLHARIMNQYLQNMKKYFDRLENIQQPPEDITVKEYSLKQKVNHKKTNIFKTWKM